MGPAEAPQQSADALRASAGTAPGAPGGWRRWLPSLAAWAALFAVLAWRREGAILAPQLWGDDAVYLRDQLLRGAAALGQPYGGYWQLAARLVAQLAALLPLSQLPRVYTVAALAAAAACCAAFADPWFRPLLRGDALRATLCLLAAAAVYSDELVGTPTNLQWYLLLLGVLLVARPPAGLGWSAVGFLCAASQPLLALATPPTAVRLLRHRQRPTPLEWGVLAGLGVQLALAASGGPRAPAPPLAALDLALGVPLAWSHRVAGALLLGAPAIAGRAAAPALAVGIGTAVAASVGIALLAWRRPQQRMAIAYAAFLAVAGFVVPYFLRGRLHELSPASLPLRDERYFFLPALATLYLLAIAVERLPRPALVLLACCGAGIVANARVAALRGPGWEEELPAIRAWLAALRRGEVPAPVVFPLSPAPWQLVLPGGVPDPGFETAELHWGGLAPPPELARDVARSGRQSLRLMGDSPLAFADVLARPGVRHTASAWAWVPCGQPGAAVALWLHDGHERQPAGDGPREVRCGAWTPLGVDYPGPPSRLARIHLQCWRCPLGVWWDDVRFVPAAAAPSLGP